MKKSYVLVVNDEIISDIFNDLNLAEREAMKIISLHDKIYVCELHEVILIGVESIKL